MARVRAMSRETADKRTAVMRERVPESSSRRGRGYAAEAVRALATWSFTGLGVQRLEWRAEAGNTASRAVAMKVGSAMEGVLRAAQTSDNSLRDTWIGALLPSDLGLPFAVPHHAAQVNAPA